jgi:hypothetical protein
VTSDATQVVLAISVSSKTNFSTCVARLLFDGSARVTAWHRLFFLKIPALWPIMGRLHYESAGGK